MRYPSLYLKMRVLGAIETAPGKTRVERIKHVATTPFIDEDGNPRIFTWRTIQTWYSRYQKHGITGVTGGSRSDKGKPRKITPEELLEAINKALPHFEERKRRSRTPYNKMQIYRYCIERGYLQKERLAQTTFFRFVREYDLLQSESGEKNRRRLAFCMQYANQLWQADTMVGPHVLDQNRKRQTYLIAFIDDASRVLCHGQFFLEENTDAMAEAIRAALYKRGVPEQLYVDNGAVYAGQEMTLICARLGIILRHTAVRDAASKGKIERFFLRVRQQFLSKKLDLQSLKALNRQFTLWVENEYNAANHSALGMKPIDRFGIDLKRVRFLPPSEANDEIFYAEATRKVKRDNTFSFRTVRFETPVDLHGKTIQLRYRRHHATPVVIYYKGQRSGYAKPLDPIANGLLQRKENQS